MNLKAIISNKSLVPIIGISLLFKTDLKYPLTNDGHRRKSKNKT